MGIREPHFPVFEEFRGTSYARRYELLLTRLVREGLYDATCLLLSNAARGPKGKFTQPASDLTFEKYAASLVGRAVALVGKLPKK